MILYDYKLNNRNHTCDYRNSRTRSDVSMLKEVSKLNSMSRITEFKNPNCRSTLYTVTTKRITLSVNSGLLLVLYHPQAESRDMLKTS